MATVAERYGGISADVSEIEVVPYGSFEIGLSTTSSDLDLSIEGSLQVEFGGEGPAMEVQFGRLLDEVRTVMLRWIASKLRTFSDDSVPFQSVFSARIPVIKFLDR